MTIKTEDIVGIYRESKLYCTDCASIDEVDNFKDVLTQQQLDDNGELYFCDDCGDLVYRCGPPATTGRTAGDNASQRMSVVNSIDTWRLQT